jgi:hypothetical protein
MNSVFVTSNDRFQFETKVNNLLKEGYQVGDVGCRMVAVPEAHSISPVEERWWAVLVVSSATPSMASEAVVEMTKMDETTPSKPVEKAPALSCGGFR